MAGRQRDLWLRLRDAADVLRGKAAVSAPKEPSLTPEERRARQEALLRKESRDRQVREKVREKERESRELASGPIDLPFCLLILLLTAVGLVMLLSASFPYAYYKMQDPTYFFRLQGLFALTGICFMLMASRVNYQRLRGIAKLLMIVSMVLLVLVLIPGIGRVSHNARRWIAIGNLFQFQPSEVVKLAVIVWFSSDISRKRDKMRNFREGILPYLKIMAVIAALMMLEPHLSGTILILGTGAVLMLVGGIELKWVLGAVGGAGFFAFLLVKGIIPYGQSRIAMWKNPFIDAQNQGYQLVQSLISIGSGGLFGVGLGKSRQKFLYLPEEHNDFIFAVVCEELGLIGATLIMLLFAAMILRGYWIALHARDRFGSLLVTGIITQMAMQTFFNIGVVTGFLPTTGISLPFFSYGGTAILIQLAEMGIVLSVSRQMKL